MKKNVKFITTAAIIAALYIVLTFLANALGLANGAIQVRFSEALCILPVFTPAAILGLPLGCLLSNMLTGCVIFDVIFGSLATLIGAWGTYMLRHHIKAAPLPPIAANTLIVPLVLRFAYSVPGSLGYLMLTVGIGEIISCYVLGLLLYTALNKRKGIFL